MGALIIMLKQRSTGVVGGRAGGCCDSRFVISQQTASVMRETVPVRLKLGISIPPSYLLALGKSHHFPEVL